MYEVKTQSIVIIMFAFEYVIVYFVRLLLFTIELVIIEAADKLNPSTITTEKL